MSNAATVAANPSRYLHAFLSFRLLKWSLIYVNMLYIDANSTKCSPDLSSPLILAATRLNLLPSLATAIIKGLRNRSMLIRYG